MSEIDGADQVIGARTEHRAAMATDIILANLGAASVFFVTQRPWR